MNRQEKIAKFKYTGYKTYRLNTDGNENELIFVKVFNKLLKENPRQLEQMLLPSDTKTSLDEDTSKMVVTVIQWLGTYVGQSFLKDVQKEIESKQE